MKTVSLGLSKQLKEAGYPQESYFLYYPYEDEERKGKYFLQSTHDSNYMPEIWPIQKAIASPTADEILDQLPTVIKDKEGFPLGMMILSIDGTEQRLWKVTYQEMHSDTEDIIGFNGMSLADAAAKMWLYLKKEGLL